MFLYKNLFFFQYLFFQSQSCLLESTAAIFRQSAGYVYFWGISIQKQNSSFSQYGRLKLVVLMQLLPLKAEWLDI